MRAPRDWPQLKRRNAELSFHTACFIYQTFFLKQAPLDKEAPLKCFRFQTFSLKKTPLLTEVGCQFGTPHAESAIRTSNSLADPSESTRNLLDQVQSHSGHPTVGYIPRGSDIAVNPPPQTRSGESSPRLLENAHPEPGALSVKQMCV